jgi:predicted membrane protein
MKRKHVETIIVICVFLLLLARLNRSLNYVYASLGIALMGFLWKWFREKLYWAWMKLAEILGFISGKILLTIVFVLIVIPVALFARKRKKISMQLKPGKESYFINRDHTYTKEDIDNPW